MARKSAGLRARYDVTVGAHNIHVINTASKFEPLSAAQSTVPDLLCGIAKYRPT